MVQGGSGQQWAHNSLSAAFTVVLLPMFLGSLMFRTVSCSLVHMTELQTDPFELSRCIQCFFVSRIVTPAGH